MARLRYRRWRAALAAACFLTGRLELPSLPWQASINALFGLVSQTDRKHPPKAAEPLLLIADGAVGVVPV
jgi:hypothetical protein